ncbi:sarcosine oxidase subunit delta [Ostreibacterium oceani]|uniref:Sarcosine oxidase subunit delta family protein n=1 Tax=Ostreibacterium oceani TaxID=2654998 RepID=A0A6N7EU16_9GAMM|nr:sarcosine oxidase subunit delta [Ostreibacterium oceani]MPV86041.1 sarcosine oxidase subunit delta family protein [Ostreibacterium oceani]
MLKINCPYCGVRDEIEFSYAGEAHIVRPVDGENMTDAEWADYLFNRKNPRGVHLEQWCHTAGCRQFFNAARDTVSNQFIQTYKIGEVFHLDEAVKNNEIGKETETGAEHLQEGSGS